jgi:phage gpG-like protein
VGARVLSLADLARAANAASGPLAPPLDPRKPLDARTGRELVQVVVADVKKRFATSTAPDGARWKPLRYARPRGGDRPLRDTGRLMASITGTADATSVTVGTARPGAALHQDGGVVRPRKGKFLAIPLTKEAARAGSPRKMRPSRGKPVFAKKVGGRWVGHFLLVKQAKVPARPFLGLSKEGERAVGAVLADAAARNAAPVV